MKSDTSSISIAEQASEQANSISIAELATLVTAGGVGIYVLGLIGVALSMRLTFTNSWSTAWYAASLMPRVVVAGQGTRVWRSGMYNVLLLFINAVLVGATTLLVVGMDSLLGPLYSESPWREIPQVAWGNFLEAWEFFSKNFWLGLLLVTGQFVLPTAFQVFFAVRRTRQQLETMPSVIEPRPQLLSLRSMIVMAGVGFLITLAGAYVILRSLYDPTPVFQIAVNWDSLAAGALLLLLGMFILGVPLASVIEHPLPRVRIITKPEQPSIEAGEAAAQQASDEAQEPPAAQEGSAVSGWLVAHTDSSWHLFVGVNRLDSIPDDRVTVAHIEELNPPEASESLPDAPGPQEAVQRPWWRRIIGTFIAIFLATPVLVVVGILLLLGLASKAREWVVNAYRNL